MNITNREVYPPEAQQLADFADWKTMLHNKLIAAIKKYEEMRDTNQKIMDFEGKFLEAGAFMEHKEVYIQSAEKYHKAELIVYACEKLIKNCNWILDIE